MIDVGEPSVGYVLGEALPLESAVSVEVEIFAMEGAVGILVKVCQGQATIVDQESRHGPHQPILVRNVVQRHGIPRHVEDAIERVCREVGPDSAIGR